MPPTQTLELDLTAMTHGGRSLGREDKRPIFVPFGIPGERVSVRITQDKRSYAFAQVEAVLEASPERVLDRVRAREIGDFTDDSRLRSGGK